ncbi:hypothetical protein RFI_10984 [Reticulomyxa filosa]|uniref:Uncharacterized protein n=1 Tax=Reticulomyxa filosa TaxID=46433 RepID=X6NIK2_RETFI|nr:hypothetical protein RFI_10984 [Reticulomyxa filosa]|eukprot:ETO26155.1 hypothetical protein RFI_10984 [Reticulomyxa filosa]
MATYGGWNNEKGFNDLWLINVNKKKQSAQKTPSNFEVEPFHWHKIDLKQLPVRIWHSMECVERRETEPVTKNVSLIIAGGEDEELWLQNDIWIIQWNVDVSWNKCSDWKDLSRWSVLHITDITFSPRYGHTINSFSQTFQSDLFLIVFGGYGGEMEALCDFCLFIFQLFILFICCKDEKNEFSIRSCKNIEPKECLCLTKSNLVTSKCILPNGRFGHTCTAARNEIRPIKSTVQENQQPLLSTLSTVVYIFGGKDLNFERFSDVTCIAFFKLFQKQGRKHKHRSKFDFHKTDCGSILKDLVFFFFFLDLSGPFLRPAQQILVYLVEESFNFSKNVLNLLFHNQYRKNHILFICIV